MEEKDNKLDIIEPGEESVKILPIKEVITEDITIGDIVGADVIDLVDGSLAGGYYKTDSKLLEEIRGCKASEYARKCEEAEKNWSTVKLKVPNRVQIVLTR